MAYHVNTDTSAANNQVWQTNKPGLYAHAPMERSNAASSAELAAMAAAVNCSRCQQPMKQCTAKTGKNEGRAFYVCDPCGGGFQRWVHGQQSSDASAGPSRLDKVEARLNSIEVWMQQHP